MDQHPSPLRHQYQGYQVATRHQEPSSLFLATSRRHHVIRDKSQGLPRSKLVMAQYPSGKDWGSVRNCTDDGISEHLEGRAWDWNVNVKNATQFAQAAQLLTWLTDNDGYNARRLGIMYIGYNARIWGRTEPRRVAAAVEQQSAHRPCAFFVYVERGDEEDILLDWFDPTRGLRAVPSLRRAASTDSESGKPNSLPHCSCAAKLHCVARSSCGGEQGLEGDASATKGEARIAS